MISGFQHSSTPLFFLLPAALLAAGAGCKGAPDRKASRAPVASRPTQDAEKPMSQTAAPMTFKNIDGYRGKVFLGIQSETVKLPEDPRYPSTYGLRVYLVGAESAAEKGGVRVGDTIVSMDGEEWNSEQIRLSRSFGKAGRKFQPGETVHFRILRPDGQHPDSLPSLIDLEITLLPYPLTAAEEPRAPTNNMLRPDLAEYHPAYKALCWKLVRELGYEPDCRDLLLRLERAEEFPDLHRLPLVRTVHRDPFTLEPVSREIIDAAREKSGRGAGDAPFFLEEAERILLRFAADPGRAVEEPIPGRASELPGYRGTDLNGHLVYVEAVLKAAAGCNRKAFDKYSREEIQHLVTHRGGMLDSYVEYRMLSYDSNVLRQRASVELVRLAKKVDLEALFQQARLAARLVDPEFSDSLRKAAEASGLNLDGGPIAERNTAAGPIVVSGRGRTRHQGTHYAALFELGGDDVYANNTGSSVVGAIPTAVLVDYAGNDAYENHEKFSQGCGDLGVGILLDLDGNDSYVGTRFDQGTGFLGIGMLFDARGDDLYRGIEFHQGVGHWGLGLLVDSQGNDRYESHDTSQAVGLPGGCGFLYDGGNGSDSYYCKGKKPTGYGTPGVFEGWGQAMGVGYRPYASGGVGVLFDEGGADHFEAGNFCQGGGYFYSFGLLYSGGGENDRYIGSRYAQGFGCHQAAGAFIEQGGDDHYLTRDSVAQGLSWDEATGLFIDEAGNDRYEGGGFSHGASAMNGWTLFLERGGKDTYIFTDQARAGGNDYHGGTSLSFFLDAGGDPDLYPSKPNAAIQHGKEHFIFVDLPGTIDEALANERWKDLMGR